MKRIQDCLFLFIVRDKISFPKAAGRNSINLFESLKRSGLLILSRVLPLLLLSSLSVKAEQQFNSQVRDDVFRAGAAKVKITPPVGSIMGNSYGIGVSQGIHDDLHARTLVFKQGDVKAAFIALDIISVPYFLVVKSREMIATETGIPKENIILCATHVHAGPQLNPLFWDAVGGLPKQKSTEYFEKLPSMIATSVNEAIDKLQPVKVSVGTVQETTVNFNRRFLMKDGTFRMNPGKLNPNSVRAMGPIDPDLNVVYFETLDSKPLATLVNFALHPAIVGGNEFSADFPGKIADLLATVKGEEMVTVFTNGNSGNINHVDVNQPNQLGGQSESTRIAVILAGDVMKALSSLRPLEINKLQVSTREVELPAFEFKEGDVKWAKEVVAKMGQPKSPPFSDLVQAWKIIDLYDFGGGDEERFKLTTTVPIKQGGGVLKSEVNAIVLGDELALVGFPGDAFVELGLAIKQNSPYPYTIVNEQSGNGTLSYVPNRKAFYEKGYEAESARFLPGGGEILVDAVTRILIDLFPYRTN